MDTIQKNREAALPESAQQRNGAVRSAEAQRSAAGRPVRSAPSEAKPRPASETPAKAPAKKRPPQEKQPERPAQKKAAAPKQKKPATKAEPQKRKAAPAQTKETPRKKPTAKTTAPKTQKPKAQTQQKGLPDSVSTKKRAYGNSKPKKKSALTLVNEAVKRSADQRAEKIKARQAAREKGPLKKSHTQQNAPAVIYTQPQAFNRSRLFIQLITVVAVVLALVLGLSLFFKVENVAVAGASVYSIDAVQEASGIEKGDNLFTFSHARAAAQIKANLPYVNSVRFGIKLPDTVNIIIDEADVVYAIKNQEGTWWLMNSNGRLVEQSTNAKAANYTQILGVTVADPMPDTQAVATESAALTETDPATGETVMVPVSVTGAQRLNAALQIVQALEANDIVGDAASVDVTRLEDIILWYGSRYQVNFGDSTNLAYKVDCMYDVIHQLSEYQTGVLDISFTIWPNQVGYTPFG